MLNKRLQKNRRHGRIRSKISGTSQRPRLCISRSNKFIYAQLIDDETGRVIARESGKKTLKEAANVGEKLAKKAIESKIEKAVFDRGGYKYHGRVKALGEGARKGGLNF